jgi:hypothetical protein
VLAGALASLACHPRVKPPETETPPALQAVEVTSRLKGTVAGAGPAELTFVGVAAHTQRRLSVVFVAKQLVAVDPGVLGPVSITLDLRRQSSGTLASASFPTEHRQDFFLQINSEKLGTLISDDPVTLSARIEGSPPTATYKSVSGDVAFFKEGDAGKRPVFTVQEVTSEVRPAVPRPIDITSRFKATAGNRQVDLELRGTAVGLLSRTSTLFIAKRLSAVNPGRVGPLTVTLNPRRQSIGTLASDEFPTEHRQSFFLQIDSRRLGRLVSDRPLVLAARISSCPPTATYLSREPVEFYRLDDPGKGPCSRSKAWNPT